MASDHEPVRLGKLLLLLPHLRNKHPNYQDDGADSPEARFEAFQSSEEARRVPHLQACGVPLTEAEAAVDPELTLARRMVEEWEADGRESLLLLLGSPQVGTTAAAAGSLLRCFREVPFLLSSGMRPARQYDHRRGLFLPARDLALAGLYSEEGKALWARVKTVERLVLDNLCLTPTMAAGAIWQDSLQDLLTRRVSNRLRTVVTAPHPWKAHPSYPERVFARQVTPDLADWLAATAYLRQPTRLYP